MNIKYMMMLTLAVLACRAHADFSAQQDGVSVTIRAPEGSEQVLSAYGVALKAQNFISKKLNPVWIELTNTSDRAIELSNRSLSAVQVDRETVAKKYKYRTILRPFLVWLGVRLLCIVPDWYPFGKFLVAGILANIDQGVRQNVLAAELQNIIETEIGLETLGSMPQEKQQSWIENNQKCRDAIARTKKTSQDAMNKLKQDVSDYHKGYQPIWKALTAIKWGNCAAAIASWWFFSSFNKELDEQLNQHLLQDPVIIAPGQTVKKLVLLDGDVAVNRFGLSTFDARTHLVRSQFNVVLQ